jgi:multidrug efflux pump subunit AcrA (membrane-fusion protein)
VEERTLFFKTGGYVKQVLVARNDNVKQGDLLVELENDDLLKQKAQAEVALASAQITLDEAESALAQNTAEAQLDLAVARARLAQAQKERANAIDRSELALTVAQEQLARLKAQAPQFTATIVTARNGLVQAQDQLAQAELEYSKAQDRTWEPPEVLEGYLRAVQSAQRNLGMAQARYNEALAAQTVYEHDLKIQDLAISQAELALSQLEDGIDPQLEIEVQRSQQHLNWLNEGVNPVLVNEVNQAQLALERLQAQVAEAQIVAPIDGQILSLSAYEGRFIEAYTPAIIIADPTALEVSASIGGSQVERLVEGQETTVVMNAFPGETWKGTVRQLPYPYGSGGNTQGLAGADDSVRISLDGNLTRLELGDLARVTVVLEQKNDALWLPPAAIRTFQGREFVVVRDGERQRRVDVRIGIEGNDRVEILDGVEEGQTVVGN